MNLSEIKAIYDERKKTTDHESLKKIRTAIENKVRETRIEIEKQLDSNNIKEALENFKTLNDFRKDLSGSFKEISNQFATVKTKLEKKFNEIYIVFSGRFSSTSLCIFNIDDEMENGVMACFDNLIEFSKFKFELIGKKFLQFSNIFPSIYLFTFCFVLLFFVTKSQMK